MGNGFEGLKSLITTATNDAAKPLTDAENAAAAAIGKAADADNGKPVEAKPVTVSAAPQPDKPVEAGKAADLKPGETVSGDRGAPDTGKVVTPPVEAKPAATPPAKPLTKAQRKAANKAAAAAKAAANGKPAGKVSNATPPVVKVGNHLVATGDKPNYDNVDGYNGTAWLNLARNPTKQFTHFVPPLNVFIFSDGTFGDADAAVPAGKVVIDVVTWRHCVVAQRALGIHGQGATQINMAQATALRPDSAQLDLQQWANVRQYVLDHSGKPAGHADPKHNMVFGPAAKIITQRLCVVFVGTALNQHRGKRLGLLPKGLAMVRPALAGAGLKMPAYFEAGGVFAKMPGFKAA